MCMYALRSYELFKMFIILSLSVIFNIVFFLGMKRILELNCSIVRFIMVLTWILRDHKCDDCSKASNFIKHLNSGKDKGFQCPQCYKKNRKKIII